jgi:hypothetical protein
MSLDKQSLKKIVVSLLPAVAMVALLTWLYLGTRKTETQPVETNETTEMRPSQPSVPQQENNVASNSQDGATPLQQPPAEQQAKEAEEASLPPVEDFPVEPPPELGDLSDAPLWKQLIDGDFATRFITLLDEVTMGFIPVKSLGAFKSDNAFAAVEENDEWFMTPETEARYAPFVELFCSLDPELAGNVFLAIKPSLQSAMNAFGHTDQTPEQLLQSAMEKLRQVPLYESNPPMNKVADGLFTWKYPELEALSPAQNTLLRMGQQNLRKVREKAEQLIVEIQ